jgi:hypothetical protein
MKETGEFIKSVWWWNALLDLCIFLMSLAYLGVILKEYQGLTNHGTFLFTILAVSCMHFIAWAIIFVNKLIKRKVLESIIILLHMIFLFVTVAILGPLFFVVIFIEDK